MKYLKIILGLLIFLNCSLKSFSQGKGSYSSVNKKAVKTLEKGNKLMSLRDFKGAIAEFEKATQIDPNFFEAHMQLIDMYTKFYPNKEKWLEHTEKALSIKNKTAYNTINLLVKYTNYVFEEGDYEKALTYLAKIQSQRPLRKDFQELSDKLTIEANYGIEAMKAPLLFSPQKLSDEVNFAKGNYFPTVTADDRFMIYTAMSQQKNFKAEDIIIVQNDNGKWVNPQSISENINTQFNEGAASISGDSKTLVFTRCNQPDGVGNCDLYISYRTGNEWSEARNLGEVLNSRAWDSQPSLSSDGRVLIFSSMRPGGFGKEDLYISYKQENGAWSEPENMGDYVNTSERDLSPFLHANGRTLYFASTGYYEQNFGGFDLFQTDIIFKDKPKNLGYPVNTSKNESTVFISADSKKGYYGLNEGDATVNYRTLIYQFDVPEQIQPQFVANYAKGKITDAKTGKVLSAVVEVIDLKTKQVSQKTTSDSKTGEYLVTLSEGNEYGLYVSKKGYLHESKYLDYTDIKSFDPKELDVKLKPIISGESIVLENIFFETGSYKLDDKSSSELDKVVKILNDNPTIKVEISGHTDDVGSNSANLTLSQNRAKSVKTYLTEKGITSSKIVSKGYGETKPVHPNDTDENRAKNRRIEFKVL